MLVETLILAIIPPVLQLQPRSVRPSTVSNLVPSRVIARRRRCALKLDDDSLRAAKLGYLSAIVE